MSRKYHAQEDCRIHSEDNLRNADGRFAAANPRRSDHRLARVIRNFTPLLPFMLLTPLTNLLAEGKARKLTPTLNAVCHGFNRRVTAVRPARRVRENPR